MKLKFRWAILAFLAEVVLSQGCGGQPVSTPALWTHPDRIPVLCVAPNGGLLAFAEQRSVASDSGYINATLQRSMDNGVDWTPLQIVGGDGINTFSCGAAVIDHTNDTVFFFVGRSLAGDTEAMIDNGTSEDTKRIYLYSSTDDGTNWSGPVDISSSVKQTNWNFCDPGPGTGIQLTGGRLVVPWYYSIGTNYYSTVMYSDDDGATWTSSFGATNNLPGYSENNVVALTNGTLMMLARNDTGVGSTVGASYSADNGVTWTGMTNTSLPYFGSCVSLVRYTLSPPRLLFCNPAAGNLSDPNGRSNGTVRVSYDEGNTWAVSQCYFSNYFGYSSLTILPNNNWAMLGENGTIVYYDQISFLTDTLSNLTSGADVLNPPPPPSLGISAAPGGVIVSWPAVAGNFALQQMALADSMGWTDAAIVSEIVTNDQTQAFVASTNSTQIFRLASP